MQLFVALAGRSPISRNPGHNFIKNRSLLFIMRVSFLAMFMLFLGMQLLLARSSVGQSANETFITLELKETSISEALKKIEKITDFLFAYQPQKFFAFEKVSLGKETRSVSATIELILRNTNLTYRQAGNHIILYKNNNKGISTNQVEVVAQKQFTDTTLIGVIRSEETGLPLENVSIAIKGKKIGTVTNSKGEFSLQLDAISGILVISSVGYEVQEFKLDGSKSLSITLKTSTQKMDDVVVVGYGSQKKSDLTGAISSLRGDKLKELPVLSLEQAMAGRMAGVQVQQTSGAPGAGISVRIRGVSSMVGGNEPLYVIDGLPQLNGDVRGSNGLASINPSDIESIEVLKDASSTAIYGSRGANGVVMITTKSGKSGQPRVTFESSFGQQKLRKKIELMNSSEYVDFAKRYYTNSGLPLPTDLANFTPTVSTDWQDEIFGTGILADNNLNISGGTDRNRYFISAGYLNQKGIVKNSDFSRGSLRLNLDSKVSEHFSVTTRLLFSRAIQNGFAASIGDNTRNFGKSGIGSVLVGVTTVPVYDANGKYSDATPFTFNGIDAENPVAIADGALDMNTTTRMQGGIDLKLTIVKGLTNTTRFGADYSSIRRDLYFPQTLSRLGNFVGVSELGLNDRSAGLVENFLEYKRDIKTGLALEAIGGVSLQKERLNINELAASGYANDALRNYNFSSATTVSKPVTDVIETTLVSAFLRARLNFKDKYLFAASIRRDGASVFAENNKYGVFPSLSAAWRVSEENFMKSLSFISNLKVRSSWGTTGNPAIKPYQSLPLGISVNTAQGAGSSLAVGLAPTYPNPNLKWETSTQTNLGLDAAVLNDRIRVSFDYYVKLTSGLLALVQLPPSAGVGGGIGTGAGQIIENVGEVENKGWEITIGSTIVNSGEFSFSLDVNLSQNKNKVTATKNNKDLPNDATGSKSVFRVGYPLSSFVGPKFLGLDANGVPMHQNLNGDKDASGNDLINSLDDQIIGNPYPDLYYGINPVLKYKKLMFTMIWTGVSGSNIHNTSLFDQTNPAVANQYNKLKIANEFYPRPSQNASNRHFRSDRFMEDGSFFRMRNIRFDYSFTLKVNSAIKALNVYVAGQNLVTFTEYSGYDPEVNTFNGNDRRQGIDHAGYPTSKGYNVGFIVTL